MKDRRIRRARTRVALAGVATLVASVAVALSPATAAAVEQTLKNGCSSPETYSGQLRSPLFTAPSSGGQVTFQGWFEAESVDPGGHDLATVLYSVGGVFPEDALVGRLIDTAPVNDPNLSGQDVGYSNNGTGVAPDFQSYTFPLPVGAQNQLNVRIHFQFDTVDTIFNGFRGFAVDNVSISTNGSPLTQTFESGLGLWEADGASAGAPFWHVLNNPAGTSIISPEINPDLVTLAGGDSGALPAAFGGSGVAWFGDDATGTFCGPDYANRFTEPPADPPPPVIPPPPPPPPPDPVDTLAELPNPVLGEDVNVQRLSGEVRIGVPAGTAASARRGRARASQKGLTFVPLSQVRQIPVGSTLDTSKGSVRIQSASNASGARQNGDFARGLFQILQSRKRSAKGLTEARLKGSSFSSCKTAKGRRADAHTSASRRIRRLSANTRGRFRTRGRHSSATVRGTKWEMTDRCDGTLTTVARGKVAVRDFRRKKTIIVKTGKRYLAKAPR